MARKTAPAPAPDGFAYDDATMADVIAGQRQAAQNESAKWAAVAIKQKAELEGLRKRIAELEAAQRKPPARKHA